MTSAAPASLFDRATEGRAAVYSGMHAGALDAYAFGIVICDADRNVQFVNGAAEAMARDGAGLLLLASRRLGALVPSEGFALARRIREAASCGRGGAIRLTGRSGAMALLGLVTPLPRRLGESGGAGHALISLRATEDRPALSEATLAAMFGLSPAQASIALAIFSNRTPEEIALERGVRITTLRSHLAEIFARTGVENQRELVRLLGLLPPLRHC
jgi:DNA-binding CsgD family transcriptional regulator